MNTQKILFATDFSVAGNEALETAVSLARDRDATLLIVHCAEEPLGYPGEFGLGMPVPSDAELQGLLSSVKEKVQGVPCETRLVHGAASQGIVGTAEKEDVDLIVMGTHGRTGFLRVLMGSVAEAVVRHAHCPVLTIRQSKRALAKAS